MRTEDEALQCAVNHPNMADQSDEAVPVEFELLAERIRMEVCEDRVFKPVRR